MLESIITADPLTEVESLSRRPLAHAACPLALSRAFSCMRKPHVLQEMRGRRLLLEVIEAIVPPFFYAARTNRKRVSILERGSTSRLTHHSCGRPRRAEERPGLP